MTVSTQLSKDKLKRDGKHHLTSTRYFPEFITLEHPDRIAAFQLVVLLPAVLANVFFPVIGLFGENFGQARQGLLFIHSPGSFFPGIDADAAVKMG